ncbi:DUF624 domain-containing protein [Acholeplasma vituli]|uniref:DUF624 domain-containing protein n=1 Tax=Paracholeplasma vituli TaxID=69473 RepID=A0ABT2PVA6_9MOLU|nr:DUF624 domain-containing protein [Paracholeplasma vituli]MCU0104269.1 DUF624 domain-containing protein [Paracholeplasma vituli]
MNFFERYVNSKLYQYTDLLFKMIWLNLLMILTTVVGLGVFGLPIALSSGILTMRGILKKPSMNVFQTYFQVIKTKWKTALKTGLIYELLLFVLGFNMTFFYTNLDPFNWFNFIALMITTFMWLITIVAFYHGLILTMLYPVRFKGIFKHSYLLTVGFVLRSFIAILILFLVLYVILWIPLLGIIIGISGLLLIIAYILHKPYVEIDSLREDFYKTLESYLQ